MRIIILNTFDFRFLNRRTTTFLKIQKKKHTHCRLATIRDEDIIIIESIALNIEYWNSQTVEDWLTKHSIEFRFNSINSWSFWKGFSISNGYLLSTRTFWNSFNLYVTIFCINAVLLCVCSSIHIEYEKFTFFEIDRWALSS